jgi:hypothetical protein
LGDCAYHENINSFLLQLGGLHCQVWILATMTLGHLIFLWGFLKESTAITEEVWWTLIMKVNRLLPALTNKLFEKFQETV